MARRLVLYKRWTPRPGATSEAIVAFVRDRTIPMYAKLSSEVTLGLEFATDGRSILAVQRWSSRAAHQAATTGAAFDQWWEEYRPMLDDWDRMLSFDSEWETLELF